MTWLIHDYETENYEYFGSLASPHDDRNYIVATGWCIDNQPVQSEYYSDSTAASKSDWFAKALEGQKVYVAHNATFEIHWNLKVYGDVFLNWIRQGGKIWCTQYAEYLLSHQLDMYPKLEDCAIKYGGTKKIDEVKMLWQAGYKTSEIDQALLMEYLADQKCGDVANTRLVCFKQVAEAKKRGMYIMMQMRMDSLLFNALATFNGLKVDLDIANTNQAEQEVRIQEIKDDILKHLPPDVPPELEFSFTSPYHMSALMYGGSVRYAKKVSYEPKKFDKVDCYQFDNGVFGSVSMIEAAENLAQWECDHGEIIRYKSGKNKGLPKVFKIDSDIEKLKWGEGAFKFDGLIDLETLPPLAKDQFLGKRAEFRGDRELACGTSVYSTSKDALDVLTAHGVVQAKPLKELAALEKDTGTYYLRTDSKGVQKGMLQFVEPTGIIHHQLNSCSTVTTRLSSSRPNLQNVPKDGTSKVKQMFVSRFGSEGRIVEVDYTALEVVTLASISGDSNLLEQLLSGTDMHCYRLAFKLSEPYDEVYQKCHDKSHPDHKEYKELRSAIKTPSFADQYGASEYGVAYAAGCSVEFAREFQENESKLFPQAKAYAHTFVRPDVEATGMEAPKEREYTEAGTWRSYRRGYFKSKGGTCYSFRQYPKRVEGREVMDYKDTQVANYWCQGEAAFIVQVGAGLVIRYLIEKNFADGLVLPINTVHDAFYLDCATEELAIQYGKEIRDIMAYAPKYLAEQIPEYQDWDYHVTPFPAAAEYGVNMADKVNID